MSDDCDNGFDSRAFDEIENLSEVERLNDSENKVEFAGSGKIVSSLEPSRKTESKSGCETGTNEETEKSEVSEDKIDAEKFCEIAK